MIVYGTLLTFGLIGFGIPARYMRAYMVFASICISSLYFFYNPPISDLARHYQTLKILRNSDLGTILFGKVVTKNNNVLMWISDSSKVYLVYAYLISKTGIDGLLPALTGVIIYCSVTKIIIMAYEDMGKETEDWMVSFCFFFLLVMLDFRTISGIRNMMAYALFAYVLYLDLVRNANKLICFLAYFLIVNIHSSVFILIVLRLLVSCNRVVPKPVTILAAGLFFTFFDVARNILIRFADIPFIMSLIRMIDSYVINGRGTEYIILRALVRLTHMFFYLCIYLYARKYLNKYERFRRFGDFFVLLLAFTLGSIRQYDIFVRHNVMMYFTIYPFLLIILISICETPFVLRLPDDSSYGLREVTVYMMIVGCIVLSLLLYRNYYMPMDSGFLI